jgi:DNA mismatch endonuclease, patch repair protein
MADVFSKAKRSEVMRAVKSKNTKLEILFRKALWKKGFRYSTNSKKYFGTPDIVLRKHNTVIFVDSCFWHGCGKHFRLPAVRRKFWKDKIETNRRRDKNVSAFYRRRGWTVLRFWQHDIMTELNRLVQIVEHSLR